MNMSPAASLGAQEAITRVKQHYASGYYIVDNQLVSRMAGAIAIIHTVGAAIVDAVKGTFFAVASIATLGCFKEVNMTASKNLDEAGSIIARVFAAGLRTLNPKAKFDCFYRYERKEDFENYSGGVVCRYTLYLLKDLHEGAVDHKNFFVNKVASRLISVIKIPTAIIARVADLAIGVFVGALATITLGKINELNMIAYAHLQGLKVVADIFGSAVEILNPKGFTEEKFYL